jgi:hypothetical protein
VGQVLGFNGANLAWQDTSVGGVQVVDSLGQEVGPLARSLGPLALRQIGPIVFQLGVDSNGFNLNSISFYYTSQNCSGLRYLQQDQTTTLWRTTYIRGTRAFYPSDPLEQINVMSREDIPPNADPNLPGQCKSDVRIISGGSVAIFDLSTLGLVPPFRLEY